MTSLISSYDDLANEIARLHIDDSSSVQPQQEQNKLRLGLIQIIENTAIRGNALLDDSKEGVYEFTNLYDTIPMDFQIFIKVRFSHRKKQISVFATILKNGLPIRVQNKNQRILLNNFLLRTNGGMKYGSFKLNPLNGQISLSFNSLMTVLQYESMLFEPSKCVQYLDQELLKVKILFRMHWYKILHLLNYLPINFSQEPQLAGFKIRTMVPNISHKLELLQKISPYLHLQFPFMNMEQGIGKGLKAEDIKKMNVKFQHACLQSKQIHEDVTKVFKLLSPLSLKIKIGQKFLEPEKNQFKNSLAFPTIRYRQGEPGQIYSEIKVLSSKNWEIIDQGGFGAISKGVIEVTYPNMPGQSIKRLIVRKEDLMPNKQKLTHEKKILQRMKDKKSPFIAKFFYSEQEELKNYLFIELCAHKSLANYRMKFRQFMSLETKLIILKYLAQGMKFLKDQGIYHLDIKPSNILFGSTHVKITDFGQSYHRDVCARGFRPGTSLPYAPPQSFFPTDISYNDRLDVFSFGMLMFELIFDCYPFEYSKNKIEVLRKCYMEKTFSKLFVMSPQKLSSYGYKCVIDFLGLLSMKCLDERDSRRPCIEWIIVCLQTCLNLLSYLHF